MTTANQPEEMMTMTSLAENPNVTLMTNSMDTLEAPELGIPSDLAKLKLELVPALDENEEMVNGDELLKRAHRALANYGEGMAGHLYQSRESIPGPWRRFCLVFPGTVKKDAVGDRRVLSLNWNGSEWYVGLRWLDRNWGHFTRFVRLMETQ